MFYIYLASIGCQCCSCRHQPLRRWRSWLTSWQFLRTIWKHARRKTPTILGRIFLKSHERFIDFLKGALAHAAGSVARSFLGDQDNAPDVATAAQNWHNAYAAMPEKRQRRFWVRFFLSHQWKTDFYRVHWPMRLVHSPKVSWVKKLPHQLNLMPRTYTAHMHQCLNTDNDDFG